MFYSAFAEFNDRAALCLADILRSKELIRTVGAQVNCMAVRWFKFLYSIHRDFDIPNIVIFWSAKCSSS